MERAWPHLVLINHWPPVAVAPASSVRANVILVVLITKLPKLKKEEEEEELVRLQVAGNSGGGLCERGVESSEYHETFVRDSSSNSVGSARLIHLLQVS